LPHVFISYVRENQKEVDTLCNELTKYGVNVWIDRNNISPGIRWRDAIRKAIEEGDFFIACFSKAYDSMHRTYMNHELALAVQVLAEYPTDRAWFIPVLLEECDVPARSIGGIETLLDIQWVALYADWDAGVQRILAVIQPIPPNVQNLIDVLHSDDDSVRSSAASALGRIGDPRAVPTLIEALKDKDYYARQNAASALDGIGEPAVPALIETLQDEDYYVRQNAAYVLRRLGTPEALKAVEEYEKQKKET